HTVTGSAPQEPWSFGEEFERINRATIELRYRLLPYIYGVMIQAAQTGIPAMRPMLLEHPNASGAVSLQDQFYFGDHVLVAPVLWPGDSARRIWVPEGRWCDFWEGTVHSGPAWITVPAPLERIPILVKEGGVIPMQPVMQYVGEKPADPLTLLVFPQDSAVAQLYEDDGISFEYQWGVFAVRTVSQRVGAREERISISAPSGSYRPARTKFVVKIVGVDRRPKAVRAVFDDDPSRSIEDGWTYDASTQSLTVTLSEEPRPISVVVTL
ncbi:MAG: glycoside hydrolase family 31 protein, partial [Proteobacteria bacterium]|nr:glycoside hydrolase family 31 protein [Pseudomonadota bacterium]